MAKFNKSAKGKTKTVNLAGGEAYKESAELEFVSILLTSFVQDQFYRSAGDTMKRVIHLMDKVPGLFAAKAAVYARNEFGMRSISHMVAAELAKSIKGQGWMYRFIENVVRRPDDMTEIVSYYKTKYGLRPFPNNMKKGLGHAFGKFDEYQLAKYQGKKNDISLVDIVNLVHPRPVEKNEAALKKLITGTLKSKGTWEAKLSNAGQKAKTKEERDELKKQAWIDLIKTRKIGYFALLRNLRNILEQAPEIVPQACELLADEKLIKKSLVLPFRYTTALDAIERSSYKKGYRSIVKALNDAIDTACSNMPKFDGETLLCLDVSGSMRVRVGRIASLFAAVIMKSNNVDLMLVGTDAKYAGYNPADSTLSLAEKFRFADGSTNFKAIFQNTKRAYDRVFILSDMQGWVGYYSPAQDFANYKHKFNCNPFIYSIDLAGHGSLQFPENQVFALAGFSEKIFDIMKLLEQDRHALVNTIKAVKF